jgi:hypothetical protein
MAKVPDPSMRRGEVRAVGALLPEVGGTAMRRFGFTQARLVAEWGRLVGPVYGRWSVPESLRMPRGSRTGGTLTIRVEGPFALQLQHVGPQLVDRVNRLLGYPAVARVRLVQGEVPRPAAADAPQPGNVAGVTDEDVRLALEALATRLAAAPAVPLPPIRPIGSG